MIVNYLKKLLQENFWVHRQIILERDSLCEIILPPEIFPVSWRVATLDDILRMELNGDMNICKEDLPYYYAISSDGNFMILGEINNEIVVYTCVVYGKKVFSHRYFDLEPGDGFVLASFTKSNWRGKGLGVFALEELRKYLLKGKPSPHLFCHVDCFNRSSLRMFEKAGYVFAKTNLYRVRFLKWDLVFQTGKYRKRFIRDPNISQPKKEVPTTSNKY